MRLFLHELLFLFYACLSLSGAVLLLSIVLRRFTKNLPLLHHCNEALALSVLPILITYLSFLGLWRIPWFTEIVMAACALFGVWFLWKQRSQATLITRQWKIALPALVVLGITLVSKWPYLLGGFTHGDEMRSFALTVGFATNGLVPAFPYDYSIPFVYPYYTFSTAAFLYRGMHGAPYPSVALLTLTLATLLAIFQLIRSLTRSLFPEKADVAGSLAIAAFFFSSLAGFKKFFGWMPAIGVQLHSAGESIAAGTHYLLAMGFALIAIVALARPREAVRKENLLTAAIALALSFGHAGIPAVPCAIACVVLALRAIWHEGISWGTREVLRAAPLSIAAMVALLLPQFWNFLTRSGGTFSFNATPTFWWERTAAGAYPNSMYLLSNVQISVAIFVLLMGPILSIAVVWGFVGWTKRAWREEGSPWRGVLIALLSIIILFTFTNAPSNDWVSRGWFVGTGLASLLAVELYLRSSKNIRHALMGITAILCLSLIVELRPMTQTSYLSQTSIERHRLPFGSIVAGAEFNDTLKDTLLSGRGILAFPPVYHVAYLLGQEELQKWGFTYLLFQPCTVSWYGKSVPNPALLSIEQKGKLFRGTCDPQPVQG